MNMSQNSDYFVVSTKEAASIISRFTPEMVQDTVEEVLQNKYRNYSMTLANIVESIETNYRLAQSGIPEYSTEVASQRNDTYLQIINMVCSAHQLRYLPKEGEDIYSAAYYIYDFLISKFNLYLINFFVNYINREKNMIYENLELAAKRKDASSYSKKLYKNSNSKLATIHANLEYVLENVCVYDIEFDDFLELAYIPDRTISRYLQGSLLDEGDFFHRIIVQYYKNNYATLTTQIKFALQGFAAAEFSDLI